MCRLRHNNEKIKEKSRKNEELTENKHEQECFNLLIDECVCNNLHNICLHNSTHEEDNILQEEVKKNKNIGKKNFMQKKV